QDHREAHHSLQAGRRSLAKQQSHKFRVSQSPENSHEGPSFRQENLRQVQSRPSPRRRPSHLREPEAQAASRELRSSRMARISGVDLPRRKHVVISLRYLYGIGPTKAREICAKTGIAPNKMTEELTDNDVKKI